VSRSDVGPTAVPVMLLGSPVVVQITSGFRAMRLVSSFARGPKHGAPKNSFHQPHQPDRHR